MLILLSFDNDNMKPSKRQVSVTSMIKKNILDTENVLLYKQLFLELVPIVL